MSLAQIFVLLVLGVPLALVFLNRLREDSAALLMASLLGLAQFWGLGVLGPAGAPDAAAGALKGFGTPEVITLLALFILTACLEKYGVTRWMAGRLLALGGRSQRRLMGLFALTAALLSLFMNTLAAGALLLPGALEAARRSGVRPGKLLIPIAYGAMLGGAATYLTTANILVSGQLRLANPPQPALGFLDFTPTGGLVAAAGLLFLFLFGKFLLPEREPPPVQVGHSSDELTRIYQLQERMWEAEVTPGSPVANLSLHQTRIGETLGLAVLGVRRGSRILPVTGPDAVIRPGDRLIIVGREERALLLQQAGLLISRPPGGAAVESRDTVFVEVIIPPRSNVEGKTLRQLAFRSAYGFTAIALWRSQRSFRTDVASFALCPGDTLLLLGAQNRLDALKNQADFIVVEAADCSPRLDRPRVMLTLGIVLGALAALFAGVPVALSMLSGAALVLASGLLSPEEAYRAIRWRAVFLIAGMISVSLAMVQTGLAQLLGEGMVRLAAPFGSLGLAAGAYILSAALTQVMGGQISPLVTAPITISAAIQLGVNPQAIAVVTAVAASVSFITPLAHPVNVIMMAPANYSFRDFIKSGWLLTLVCFLVLMAAVSLFWRL